MDVTSRRVKKGEKAVPYNKREAKLEKTSEKATEKAVKKPAKITNKTRKSIVKPGVLKTTHR